MDTDPDKKPAIAFADHDVETTQLEKVDSSSSSDHDDPFHWFTPEQGRKIKHKIDRRLVLILGAMSVKHLKVHELLIDLHFSGIAFR